MLEVVDGQVTRGYLAIHYKKNMSQSPLRSAHLEVLSCSTQRLTFFAPARKWTMALTVVRVALVVFTAWGQSAIHYKKNMSQSPLL